MVIQAHHAAGSIDESVSTDTRRADPADFPEQGVVWGQEEEGDIEMG
jgi:hypothetical protein